jgi:hypothetical protein
MSGKPCPISRGLVDFASESVKDTEINLVVAEKLLSSLDIISKLKRNSFIIASYIDSCTVDRHLIECSGVKIRGFSRSLV